MEYLAELKGVLEGERDLVLGESQVVDDLLFLVVGEGDLGQHLLAVLVDGLRVELSVGLLGEFRFLGKGRDVVFEGDVKTEGVIGVF